MQPVRTHGGKPHRVIILALCGLALVFSAVVRAEPTPAPAASPKPAAPAAPAGSPAPTTAAPAANLPSGEQIMEDYLKATGGREAYETLKNRVDEATFEVPSQGMTGKVASWSAAPNLNYSEVEVVNVGKQTTGSDGTTLWSNAMMQGPRILEGEEREFALRAIMFNPDLHWKEMYEKVETVGVEKVGDADCYKVLRTPKSGPAETAYFDKNTHLLTRVDVTMKTGMGDLPMEGYMSDYKEVDGVKVPHNITQKMAGMEQKVVYSKIDYNVDIPASRFELPAEIKALKDGAAATPAGSPAASPAGTAEPAKSPTPGATTNG
jgi:hypothetical protein